MSEKHQPHTQFWLNICQDTSAYQCGEALIRLRFRDEFNGLGLAWTEADSLLMEFIAREFEEEYKARIFAYWRQLLDITWVSELMFIRAGGKTEPI